jgi:tetrahydromethanopterin S-methyltransferase subunit B
MQRQDHGLEMLAQSAQRLGQMSTTISEELDYQNRMLDDMEEDLDVATDNLDLVTLKTREMIQRAGGKQNFLIILVLVGIAMVLFFLILYT